MRLWGVILIIIIGVRFIAHWSGKKEGLENKFDDVAIHGSGIGKLEASPSMTKISENVTSRVRGRN